MVNKKGLSDVVSTVLIILLVLAAVGIIGSIVLKQIKGTGSKIETTLGCQDIVLTPVKCTLDTTDDKTPTVLVSRGNDNADISSFDLIFEDTEGATEIRNISENLPGALGTSSYTLPADDILTKTPAKISVSATIRGSDGKDNKCPASTTKVTCTIPVGPTTGTGARIIIASGNLEQTSVDSTDSCRIIDEGSTLIVGSVSPPGTGYQLGQRAAIPNSNIGSATITGAESAIVEIAELMGTDNGIKTLKIIDGGANYGCVSKTYTALEFR